MTEGSFPEDGATENADLGSLPVRTDGGRENGAVGSMVSLRGVAARRIEATEDPTPDALRCLRALGSFARSVTGPTSLGLASHDRARRAIIGPMQRTRELVSESLRAIRMLPENDRIVAIDQLATILQGDDDDQVDDDLAVFGRVVRDRVAKSMVSAEDDRQQLVRDVEAGLADVDAGRVVADDELKRHFEAKFGAIKWS